MQRDVAALLNLSQKTVWPCIAQCKLPAHRLFFLDEYPFGRVATPEWGTAGEIPSFVEITDVDKYPADLWSCLADGLHACNIPCPVAGEAACFP